MTAVLSSPSPRCDSRRDPSTEPKRTILIVEDERIVALDLQEILNGMGYDAYAIASTADEAIAKASERCPDLVLMDIRIGGGRDGIEAAAMLRERFFVPAIFLTAHADDGTIERAKRTSPYGYLLKPVRPSELRSAIEVALYRHDSDRRLRERERRFSTTLRSIDDAIIAVDLSGNVTFMNPAAEQLTGTPLEGAVGRPAAQIVRLRREASAPLERALRERTTVHASRISFTDSSERERVLSDSAVPLLDDGELLGAVMVLRDVTDAQRERQQQELAGHLASLGSMAAGIAHEVNNPLAVVLGNAAESSLVIADARAKLQLGPLVAEDAAALLDELEQASAEVQAAGRRIERVIGELKMFARPSNEAAGRADVARAIEWARRSTLREIQGRARLSVTLEGGTLRAAIDELRLGQVLVNLLVNAAHAIEPGAADSNTIDLVASGSEECVRIEVRDSGSGISPEVRARIFEPFFTTKPRGVGTGLGLAICHGIVKNAGGNLEVESEPGRGSTFRIVLPRAASRPSAPAPSPASTTTSGANILVVDDDEAILRMVKRMLRKHQVVCASSARAALEILGTGARFDVIVCDVAMPPMSGVDLYEALQATSPELPARFIFLTAGVDSRRAQDFRRSVKNTFLDKPFAPHVLLEAIEQLLTRAARQP